MAAQPGNAALAVHPPPSGQSRTFGFADAPIRFPSLAIVVRNPRCRKRSQASGKTSYPLAIKARSKKLESNFIDVDRRGRNAAGGHRQADVVFSAPRQAYPQPLATARLKIS